MRRCIFVGSICYVHISKSSRTKLDPKARRCIIVGYDEHKKGWRCMDPQTQKVFTSRDVVFDEVSLHQPDSNEKSDKIELEPFFDSADNNSSNSVEENAHQEEVIEARMRRSSRQRRQPTHLTNYEVQLNHCYVV